MKDIFVFLTIPVVGIGITILVNRGVTTQEEAGGSTFRQVLVHTHLNDRTTAPLALVGSKHDIDTCCLIEHGIHIGIT